MYGIVLVTLESVTPLCCYLYLFMLEIFTINIFASHVVNIIPVNEFMQKNNGGALMVLKQMEDAGIQPDSETYCYLIANCECEEDISKVCQP